MSNLCFPQTLIYSKIWRIWFYTDWLSTGELCSLTPAAPPVLPEYKYQSDINKTEKILQLTNALRMVFHGQTPDIKLSQPETPFQEKIRNLLWDLTPGNPISYGYAAKLIGKEHAARAVGRACSRNPYAVLVPCHRIIGTKALGGYRWGLSLKKQLLAIEENRINQAEHSRPLAGSPIHQIQLFAD
jgi:O-6-methylguanine DNA methyltransferase